MTHESRILGLHHVTALGGHPQTLMDFYAGVLGLRLVKRTVNFDDPGTYHLYFGDATGRPGTIMTFFPWPGAPRGRPGPGQVALTSFAVRPESLGFWIARFVHFGVKYEGPESRGGPGAAAERVISFRDPDGLMLELVGHPDAEGRSGWEAPGVAVEHSIRGFHSVTLWVRDGEPTRRMLEQTLGFRHLDEDGAARRYALGSGSVGEIVCVREIGGFPRAVGGPGTIHHVAWAVADDVVQLEARAQLIEGGLDPTPVIDRKYFHSVYFHEPGGVLFELATKPPGFLIDEDAAHLGEQLMLPERLEPYRAELSRSLIPLHAPHTPLLSQPEE